MLIVFIKKFVMTKINDIDFGTIIVSLKVTIDNHVVNLSFHNFSKFLSALFLLYLANTV